MLKKTPEISQRELSYLLDIRPQSLGEILGKLEKNGYITRTPSENDKRIMIVNLTQAGKDTQIQEFSFDRVFDCLKEEEKQTLSSYLQRLIVSLEEDLGTQDSESREGYRRRGGNPFGGNPFERGGNRFGPGGNPFERNGNSFGPGGNPLGPGDIPFEHGENPFEPGENPNESGEFSGEHGEHPHGRMGGRFHQEGGNPFRDGRGFRRR